MAHEESRLKQCATLAPQDMFQNVRDVIAYIFQTVLPQWQTYPA